MLLWVLILASARRSLSALLRIRSEVARRVQPPVSLAAISLQDAFLAQFNASPLHTRIKLRHYIVVDSFFGFAIGESALHISSHFCISHFFITRFYAQLRSQFRCFSFCPMEDAATVGSANTLGHIAVAKAANFVSCVFLTNDVVALPERHGTQQYHPDQIFHKTS